MYVLLSRELAMGYIVYLSLVCGGGSVTYSTELPMRPCRGFSQHRHRISAYRNL